MDKLHDAPRRDPCDTIRMILATRSVAQLSVAQLSVAQLRCASERCGRIKLLQARDHRILLSLGKVRINR